MNRVEAEQLLHLFRSPGWATFMKIKESRLNENHKTLEWEVDAKAARVQGRIEALTLPFRKM
jgi:hypothetical protein